MMFIMFHIIYIFKLYLIKLVWKMQPTYNDLGKIKDLVRYNCYSELINIYLNPPGDNFANGAVYYTVHNTYYHNRIQTFSIF